MGALMFRGLFLLRSGAHSVSKAQVDPSARPDCYRHFLARYKTPLLAKVSWGVGGSLQALSQADALRAQRWGWHGPVVFWSVLFPRETRFPGVSLGWPPKLIALVMEL